MLVLYTRSMKRAPRRNPDDVRLGDVYGSLTVIGEGVTTAKGRMFPVMCDVCSFPSYIRFGLLSDQTQSCGCARGNHRHGGKRSRLYSIWCNMRARVNNPNIRSYRHYGGRGITIAPEWDSFSDFREWAEGNGYDDALTLDRIDNDGPYSPSNCRWASRGVQANNRRSVMALSWDGETKSLAEWSRDDRCVVPYSTAYQRVTRLGWDLEKALTTPSSSRGR